MNDIEWKAFFIAIRFIEHGNEAVSTLLAMCVSQLDSDV
jgi:hypothetical protein